MKKTTNTPSLKKIPDKYSTLPLVPAWVLMPLWLISLGLPNLIYSGINFADTLHILKWTITGVPVAVAVFIAGWRLIRYGRERLALKLDMFAILWGLVMAYCACQPLWVKIFSPTGYVLEMVCFVCVWAFYVISVASFPDWGLRFAVLAANVNAAINAVFAELQIRDMNNLKFLDGTIFADLQKYSSIILPTPGNYIGNTAQQNMFGLWLAVSVFGAVYLFVYDAWRHDPEEDGRKIWCPVISLALAVVCIKFAVTESSIICAVLAAAFIVLAFVFAFMFGNDKRTYYSVVIMLLAGWNFWGLINSISRSATLALIGGLSIMFIFAAWKFDKHHVIRFGAALLFIVVVFWASMYSPRSGGIVDKTVEIVKEAHDIGHRRGIWTTSLSMLLEHPEGVGIGQFKWHYLEAQRYGFTIFPYDWYNWQYTHWAHNEFLQFFCEGGYIGGILFLIMYFTWFIPAVRSIFKKERMTIKINAVWAFGLASLISFCAIFTRPFHRIENMVWITLAFAISNREFFSETLKAPKFGTSSKAGRTLTAIVSFVASIAALLGVMYAVALGVAWVEQFLTNSQSGSVAALLATFSLPQSFNGYAALLGVLEATVVFFGVKILLKECRHFVSWVKADDTGRREDVFSKIVGAVCIAASIAGCVYISSGIKGNYILRQALSTQNADLQLQYLNEAEKHPIVHEETMRNIGYHYMQLGEQTEDLDTLSKGFNILWEHFNHEPHSEDISRLLNFVQKYQIEPVLREIAGYFKPGTYHLQRVRQKDSGGNTVNALLLMNGPGSDDE